MIRDTSGPPSPTPFAFYDPECSCWRTSQLTFDSVSTPSSPTLPDWGSMRSGALYERQTPGHLTAGRASSSSLMPTPVAQDDQKSPEAHAAMKRRMPGGARSTITSLSVLVKAGVHNGPLMPTPTARDGKGPNQRGDTSCLHGALLPTPSVQDARHDPANEAEAERNPNTLWAKLGRLTGAPTLPLWSDGPATSDD